ncbi:MAG TPA: 23S rRNA (pseudouridine(1915)-N(3))-methyltransferase RlmH [Oscillospiraceae bacterium]|nr:23S rRNA (pseudouridine(1915)-N(3))-methyltransferase RlmH [Oscillospiraceae bacterium]
MQTVTLLCVGKLKEKFYLDAAAEYRKRLGAFCRLTLRELPEERLPERASPAQVKAALEKEGEAALRLVPAGETLVALCIEGTMLTSETLSAYLGKLATDGESRVSFVIGGSMGLSDAVKDRADLQLSLSRMTFPHHLARILLLEQIYRAYQIQNNTKYHK